MGNQVCCNRNNQELEFGDRTSKQDSIYSGKNDSHIGFNPKNIKNISQQLSDLISSKKPFQKQFSQIQKAVKIKYKGNTYYGEVNQKKKPHGYGRLYLQNGNVIISKFENGEPVGSKYIFNANGSYFHGVSQGSLTDNSQGHYSCKQYNYYGSVKNGKFQGQGKLIQNQITITGIFKEGKIQKGTLVWTERAQTQINQYQYEGQFDEQLHMQGRGKLVEPSGIYQGSFVKNQKHGYGVYTYKNGSKYEGYYSHGNKQGLGKFYNQFDQLCYDGEWKDGFPANQLDQKAFKKITSSQKEVSSARHNLNKSKHKN